MNKIVGMQIDKCFKPTGFVCPHLYCLVVENGAHVYVYGCGFPNRSIAHTIKEIGHIKQLKVTPTNYGININIPDWCPLSNSDGGNVARGNIESPTYDLLEETER